MTMQTVSVQLPKPLFLKLKRAAELSHRSVEEVLVATVNVALVEPAGLPPDLGNELAAMHLFSDDALWATAKPSLSPAEQYRLSQLNHKAGDSSLTEAEEVEQEQLLDAYWRSRENCFTLQSFRLQPWDERPESFAQNLKQLV